MVDQYGKLVALVDLDGTIADCSKSLRKHLKKLRGPNDDSSDEDKLEPPPYILARQRLIMSTPGFWLDLEPIPSGLQLIDLLYELNFDTHVFTKGPKVNSNAWAEKVEWCRAYVPDVKVIIADDKSLVSAEVLVEDWLPHIVQWRRRFPSGFVIIPTQSWNIETDVERLEKALRYDGTNLKQVRTHLEALRKINNHPL